MSPAAVHFQSPTRSSSDSMPDATAHSAFDYATPEILNPSGFADSGVRGFPPPGRSKPRLVKLRKQSASQHARSRTRTTTATTTTTTIANGTGEAGSGFNPFRSASESSDQVTNKINVANGLIGGSSGVNNGARACEGGSSNYHLKFVNAGFVFGATRDDCATSLNSEQNGGDVATESETELTKSGGHVEFVFSAKRSDVESSSLPKTSENLGKKVFGDERKMESSSELLHGEFNDAGFVFCADKNDLVCNSNTEKGESSRSVGSSGFGDSGERNGDSFCFVFGDKQSGKTSNFSVEKQESLEGLRKSDSGLGNFNTRTETISNSNADAGQFDHLGNDDKCKSGYVSTNGVSSVYGSIPVHKLPDELKKLNINHSEVASSADNTRSSSKSHLNSSADFVFGGSEKVCDSFGVSSGTNADGRQSCNTAASENIDGQYFKTCETNDAQNETGCGIASGSTGIPCSKPSTSQEGIKDFQCGKIPECHVPEDSQVNGSTAPFSFSSFGLDSHPNNYASTGQSMSADHDERDNGFTSIPKASKESFMDFKPPTWDPSCFKENLFPQVNRKLTSTQKGRSSKEKGSKQIRRRKLKPHSLNKKQTRIDDLSKESSSVEAPDSSGSNSPMDFSPYQETKADDQDVKASEELNDLHSTIPADYKDEHLASVGRGVDVNATDHICVDPDKDKLLSHNGSSSVADFHSSGPEIVWPNLKTEQLCSSCMAGASVDAGVDLSSNTERQKADQFCFVNGLGDSKEKQFAFSASSIGEGTSLSSKRKQKRKFRRKIGCDSFVTSPGLSGKFVSSIQFSPLATANTSSHSDVMDRSVINDQFKEGDVASSATIQETCDKWRLRGNQAYKDGDLSKAEDFYTLGINSVPSSEKPGCWIKPLLLCYSNRAATRMNLGRIREALEDCLLATALDPIFLKVQMRTANCHLLLGEVENARQCYNKCLESGHVVCLDRRVMIEASEGLQKVQKVVECINNAAALLKERTSDAAGTALELLAKALSISSYSEKLLQMKAEALFLLQKYDAAVQLCEQSQYLAEKNFALANNANISVSDSYSCVKLWRCSLISKCYFHLGRLEESLNVLEMSQQIVSVPDNCVIENQEELLSLAASIRELLHHKSTGNESFKLGKYAEAVEHYTVALSSNINSRPFAAICFCNRAAAHQALSQIADAIADCSMAMALDGNYAKAISRRATLHEMVRDYEQAACDLRRLLSVLETQSNEKTQQSNSPSGSNAVKESRQVHQRLLSVEDQAKRGIPLDVYQILGIKPTDTATEMKKAYHKAALRHHPDKAGQLLVSEVGDEGLVRKEILQEVHKDADRLFKMIGEAYAVLSDPAKRSEYDLEEEIRKASKQSNKGSACRRSSDVYGYGRTCDGFRPPSDRTSNRRHGRDHWKTYGHSYPRW